MKWLLSILGAVSLALPLWARPVQTNVIVLPTNIVSTNILNTNIGILTNFIAVTNPCGLISYSNEPSGLLPILQASTLPPSADDLSTNVPLPFQITFCGNRYSNIWINEDGNLTLDGAFGGHSSASPAAYTPALPLATQNRAIFAPYWADLDTTSNGFGSVTWGIACAFVPGTRDTTMAFAVTWSNVDYYHSPGHLPKANTFQALIYRPPSPVESFTLQFRYADMNWDTADSTGGNRTGLCGPGGAGIANPARVGFSGPTNCSFELPGSGSCGALINGGAQALMTHRVNSSVNGVYTWFFVNGVPSGNQ